MKGRYVRGDRQDGDEERESNSGKRKKENMVKEIVKVQKIKERRG